MMTLNPEEIFAGLITRRKEINAPECHCDYDVKPFRFVIYKPNTNGAAFHFMPCQTIRGAQNDGSIKDFRRTSKNPGLDVCGHCINMWNRNFPGNKLSAETFNLSKFFLQLRYDSQMWEGIDLPPVFDREEFSRQCLFLYRPVKLPHNVFHFMKCSDVCYEERIGWLRAYRFTDRITGKFEIEILDKEDKEKRKDKEKPKLILQTLRPCVKCLAEWDSGRGWQGYSSAEDSEKEKIRDSFSLREFASHCRSLETSLPELTELYRLMEDNSVWFGASVSNKYPGNWDEISTMYRVARNYRCEECGLDMREHTELAVVHHINGSHPDVRPENMRVLCKCCHSKQPHHERSVKVNRYEYDLLRKLHKQQHIKMT